MSSPKLTELQRATLERIAKEPGIFGRRRVAEYGLDERTVRQLQRRGLIAANVCGYLFPSVLGAEVLARLEVKP